jgi:predicted MFS family arabinose efflux permease
LFITPLGDLVRRRPLIIITVTLALAFTIGLAVTQNIEAFEALSFIVGALSVAPQILIPLAADLVPHERRASAISIVFSGLLFGVLVARVIAGIIAQFVTWRVVYYFAIGVQALVFLGSYFMLPDYPSKNKHLTYWGILSSMAKFAATEPVLIQACIINICSSACFSSFWVTLTFLLDGSPYHYSTCVNNLRSYYN